MKRKLLLLPIFLFGMLFAFAQSKEGVTFAIEKLKRPENLLTEKKSEEIVNRIAPLQIAHSQLPANMVDALAHPFFDGMYLAYSDHRPFVISPDMIWLLISQGFSHHVNNNAAALRSMFVNFEGKKSLVVTLDKTQSLGLPSTWEKVVPQFVKQVADNTSPELMANLTPQFSTTTSSEKIATQLTALESMQAYFEYIVIRVMCGIPEITIKGTPQDWKLIKEKANALRKYKLDWWIDEIDPLLDKFIDAANGKFEPTFWQNMFKYHTLEVYGKPKVIDGWIIKFYPYSRTGKRNDFKMLRSSESLPDECAVVDFKLFNERSPGAFKESDMQFVAGFFALKQDAKTQALEPQIGWLVRPTDTSERYKNEIEYSLKYSTTINIRVSEIPKEILQLRTINSLDVEFLDSIKIPAELSLIDLQYLGLTGKINESELKKIHVLFPYTVVSVVNNVDSSVDDYKYHEYMSFDSFSYNVREISEDHWSYFSLFSFNKKIGVPFALINGKQIDIFEIDWDKLSADDKQKLIDQFQDTHLIINNERIHNRQYFSEAEERKQRYQKWMTENGHTKRY